MDFLQIIMTPFSWLLRVFCQVFDSYGIALILFTIVVKLILFPFNLKAKKSMIKMNLISGQLKEIQKRCGNDRERYNQEAAVGLYFLWSFCIPCMPLSGALSDT